MLVHVGVDDEDVAVADSVGKHDRGGGVEESAIAAKVEVGRHEAMVSSSQGRLAGEARDGEGANGAVDLQGELG